MVTRGNAAYAGLFLEKPDTFDIDYAISAALSALERHDNASGSPLRRSTRRPAVSRTVERHPSRRRQRPSQACGLHPHRC